MNYQIRQGTIYRKIGGSGRLLLINHNPMQLESLILQGGDAGFDTAHPALISIDTLIALRRSGEYEDTGDLPKAELNTLIGQVISGGGVTEEVAKLLQAILKE